MEPVDRFIDMDEYGYELPEDRIAYHPLPKRDDAKLLVFRADKGISHAHFYELPALLQEGDTLVFNNTKVIPARLHFVKGSGALVELFLLSPISEKSLELAMNAEKRGIWLCMVGNKKRWKEGERLSLEIDSPKGKCQLQVSWVNRENNEVLWEWSADLRFAELLELMGKMPLPPYIKREAEGADAQRYQTVYAQAQGAVAAPTAGLHFTKEVLDALTEKGVNEVFVTLHVGAGTFQPVKVQNALEHEMHAEQISVDLATLKTLANTKRVIAVGTTSLRFLESLYWLAFRWHKEGVFPSEANLAQLYPYHGWAELPPAAELFAELALELEKRGQTELVAFTQLMVVPGYAFRVCNALITNFHQPNSTLLLLVSAVSKGAWKTIYAEALAKDYRFLSYGDSSILFME